MKKNLIKKLGLAAFVVANLNCSTIQNIPKDFSESIKNTPGSLSDLVDYIRDYEVEEEKPGKYVDDGRYKSLVEQDPFNKQKVEGFLYIPTVWGEEFYVPNDLKRPVMNLVEGIKRYTDIDAKMDYHLYLSSKNIFKTPFILMTPDDIFKLTKMEQKNLSEYLYNGGFLLADDTYPEYDFSHIEASFKQMFRDTLGIHARFSPIPISHELYNCFFDFSYGPPQGDEIKKVHTRLRNDSKSPPKSSQITMPKPVFYLEGIWLKDRLVAVCSGKGYVNKWKVYENNEPQLKMGVNLVVYALTQQGSINQKNIEAYFQEE